MLVLSRKPGETVRLVSPSGELLTVKFLSVKGGRVIRLGLEAPRSWKILRGELPTEAHEKCGVAVDP